MWEWSLILGIIAIFMGLGIFSLTKIFPILKALDVPLNFALLLIGLLVMSGMFVAATGVSLSWFEWFIDNNILVAIATGLGVGGALSGLWTMLTKN